MILPFCCMNNGTWKTCQCLNSNCTVSHNLAIFLMVCSSIVVKLLLPLRNPLEDPQPWLPSLLDLPSRKQPGPEFEDWVSNCMHANQLKGEPGCPLVDPSTHCEYLWERTGQHCTFRPRSKPRSVTEAAPGVQREVWKWTRGEKINCVDFFITWLRSSFSRPLNCVGVANSACDYIENQLRSWFRTSAALITNNMSHSDQFDHL